jgi:hypothetical protein
VIEEQPKEEYHSFHTRADFQSAVDALLVQEGRILSIFDPNLAPLRLNSPERVALLERFLRESRIRRIQIVVHDSDHLTRQCPRMMGLLKLFAHAIQINRTHEEIRNLQDSFMVLDARHHVRRPIATQYRGAIGLNDENEAQAMRSRFTEIWTSSYPGVSSTTLGL